MKKAVALGLLVLCFPVPAAGNAGEEAQDLPFLLLSDADNDATRPVPLQSDGTQPFSAMDLVALRVQAEDEALLTLVLKVKALPMRAGAGLAIPYYDALYLIHFGLQGRPTTYDVTIRFGVGQTPDPPGRFVITSMSSEFGIWDGQGRNLQDPGRMVTDPDAAEMKIMIPKESLIGALPTSLGQKLQLPIQRGTVLERFYVESKVIGGVGIGSAWGDYAGDRAPDGEEYGASYVLRTSPASPTLIVRIGAGNEMLQVIPGANQSIPFTVGNLAQAKRLISLRYEIEGSAATAENVRVLGPGSLYLPARQWRNYTLQVESPSDFSESVVSRLVIRATTNNSLDNGYAAATLVPGLVLSPEQSKLFLHAPIIPGWQSSPTNDFYCQQDEKICHEPFLSMTRSDARARSDHRIERGISTEAGQGLLLPTLHALAIPASLDGKSRAEGSFFLGMSPVGMDGAHVLAELSYRQGPALLPIASGEVESLLTPEGATVRVPMTLKLGNPALIPAHVPLVLRVLVYSPDPNAASVNGHQQVFLDPEQSDVRLPVQELPDEYQVKPNPSPFQISLLGEREEFANPGKSKLFNLTVTNIDSIDQRLRIETNASRPWDVKVLPGSHFVLPASEAVRIGVLVTVPLGVGEGSRLNLTVSARADDGHVRDFKLFLTATTGSQIDDDAGNFAAADEDLDRLVVDSRKSPAPVAPVSLAIIAGLGLLAAVRSRRQARNP